MLAFPALALALLDVLNQARALELLAFGEPVLPAREGVRAALRKHLRKEMSGEPYVLVSVVTASAV